MKKEMLLPIFLLFLLIFSTKVKADTYISECSNLNESETYYLTSDIIDSSSTYCMDISANNVVLDCQGHTIDGTDTSGTYGVYIYRTAPTDTNITVKNCVITDWYNGIHLYQSQNNTLTNNTANSNSNLGIYLYSSSNNIITNSTVSNSDTIGIFLYTSSNNNIITSSTVSNSGVGISLSSSSNNNITNSIVSSNDYGIAFTSSNNNIITNSTVNSNYIYGIYFYSSYNNNITGGSIALSPISDYYLWVASTNNNFTATNFTASRKIKFDDSTSWFNYNNETTSNIWLKTKVSAQATITRSLLKWNQTNITWIEQADTTVTAQYNLTGLLANTTYKVTNSSGTYEISTDSSGSLSFLTDLTTTPQVISVLTLCNDGEYRCSDSNLEVCVDGEWTLYQECEYGCYEGECIKPFYEAMSTFVLSIIPLIISIGFILLPLRKIFTEGVTAENIIAIALAIIIGIAFLVIIINSIM